MNIKKIILSLLAVTAILCFTCGVIAACSDVNEENNGGSENTDVGANYLDDYYIVDVQMTQAPTKSKYAEGDEFNPSGLILKVVWNDGWEQEIKDGQGCLFDPTGTITMETEAITVTYDTKTFVLPLAVNAISGIALTEQPAISTYIEGEEFSTVGMEILAVLEDGSKGREIKDYRLSDNAAALQQGDTSVTVYYSRSDREMSCEVPIKVLPANKTGVFEAENGTVTNGTIVTTGSSLLNHTSGGFVKNLKKNGKIEISVPAASNTTASLRFRMSSYEDADIADASRDIKLADVITVTLNGVDVNIGNGEILTGGFDDERGAYSRFCRWYEFRIDNASLHGGVNTFVITSKVDMTDKTDLHSICFDVLRVFAEEANVIGVKPQLFETSSIFCFAPSTTTATPEVEQYSDATANIAATHMKNADGVPVTRFDVAAGTAANSGVSLNTTNATSATFAESGYTTVFPVLKGKNVVVTLHIANTGECAVSLRYAIVYYGSEAAYVECLVPAGETKTVQFNYSLSVDSTGNNHLLVIKETLTQDASFTIWGEVDLEDLPEITGLEIHQQPSKTQFKIGETFSADGLVLKPTSTKNTKFFIAYGFTTDFDEKTFTEDDVGVHTVTVGYGGIYITYQITVTAQ